MQTYLYSPVTTLGFYTPSHPLYVLPKREKPNLHESADAVCLFSGGLDSLCGSIDLFEAKKKVLLVSHYDMATPEQNTLAPALAHNYPSQVRWMRMRVGHRSARAQETTLRSRSLLFIAMGMYAARGLGPRVPLVTPENGVIALNVPLTPSRAGSCSTRTMHPYFIGKLRDALIKVGFTNPLINPFEFKTKGEVLVECANSALLQQLAHQSSSCSHPTRRQHWVRKSSGERNCGYCMPCLFRRASMNLAGWDDGNKYGIDVCQGELLPTKRWASVNDLRAVLAFMSAHKTAVEIERDISRIASVTSPKQRAEMVARGWEEMRALIRKKGIAPLRSAAKV